MPRKHYVIIGNGVAANRAAAVLRSGDPEGRITLISDERTGFYNRHLLPDYLVGKVEEEDLLINPPEYYKNLDIKLRLGQEVVKCDTGENTLYLGHKEKVRYTTLLVCSGGRPRIPEPYHALQQHFTVLKTLADARGLRECMPHIRRVMILGGDLISVKLANVLKGAGKDVTFLLEGNAFWPLELTKERRGDFAKNLEKAGHTVLADDTVTAIEFLDGEYQVRTAGGREFATGMVGAFFGLDPDVGFLLGSGIHVERGVLVNEFLRTNVPNVYAAGDCAKIYNPTVKNYWVSIGWPNAERLGEIAAGNILGHLEKIERAPASVFRFGEIMVNTSWWKEF